MQTKMFGIARWCAMGLLVLSGAQAMAADETPRAPQRAVPVFEGEKTWGFDDDGGLEFYNESRNPKNTRFLNWKEYTYVVTDDTILCIDTRPYGTRVQAPRHQLLKGGKAQTDKQLMDDLKKRAKKAREEKEPKAEGGNLPVNINVGAGFGFRF